MQIRRLLIKNFRSIKSATFLLPKHSVLIGDNNIGKTTILEAIDLVLGPDRLSRTPPIDEHDFYRGEYITKATKAPAVGTPPAPPEAAPTAGTEGGACIMPTVPDDVACEYPQIDIEVTITDLNGEQIGKFGQYTEFWDTSTEHFYTEPNPEGVDGTSICEALRVTFIGCYDQEEDDFQGKTYFTRSCIEDDRPVVFTKKHKQLCGYLYLRSLRTGSRALSLERGSLLDIILRLKEVRPNMWEDTICRLASYSVAGDPALGLSGILESINQALNKYVPKEWGVEPQLKVSNLTREHLRKVITAFMATGEDGHTAPFDRQGRGTINMLVLALLSVIAEERLNVIFAMEEPETAIPPYAQKRIVHEIRRLASQTIFTSHSPYVLEEFEPAETVVLSRDRAGELGQKKINLPESVKLKRYRQQFRTRFCEGLLARRVLFTEGAAEASAFPAACRRLAELKPDAYLSLEAIGICTIDAGSETQIEDLAKLYRELGKRTFAFCDKQTDENKTKIEAQVEILFMHSEKGIEDLILNNTTDEALVRFVGIIEWPPHLLQKFPDPKIQAKNALKDFFGWTKGNWGIADFVAQCSEAEIPQWIRDACASLNRVCNPPPAGADAMAAAQQTAAA